MAIDLNVRLRSADMPLAMQERAIRKARALVDAKNPGITKPTQVAMCLKKEFDALYGPAWHCIVGKSFGSFVTHAGGGFLYFSVDKLCFLLFKTEESVAKIQDSWPCLFGREVILFERLKRRKMMRNGTQWKRYK
ncbi:hypothetical protein V6Z11_D07G048200 [Gossypium hirsutum]